VDRELLKRQAIITPSCGMGSLEVGLTEHILVLLSEVSRRFRDAL